MADKSLFTAELHRPLLGTSGGQGWSAHNSIPSNNRAATKKLGKCLSGVTGGHWWVSYADTSHSPEDTCPGNERASVRADSQRC